MHADDFRYWDAAMHARPVTVVHEPGKTSVRRIEKGVSVPLTESLRDCFCRISPLWSFGVVPRLLRGETVLIVAHANSIRALIYHIDGDIMTLDNLRDVKIPSAVPLVYDFEIESNNSLRPIGKPSDLGMRGYFIVSEDLKSEVGP